MARGDLDGFQADGGHEVAHNSAFATSAATTTTACPGNKGGLVPEEELALAQAQHRW